MSTIAEKALRADQPESSGAAQRVRFSQPLRRHLKSIRENLQRGDRSLAPAPLDESSPAMTTMDRELVCAE